MQSPMQSHFLPLYNVQRSSRGALYSQRILVRPIVKFPPVVILTFALALYAQRLETVAAIYDKLCRYKYVQVCLNSGVLQQILT